MQNNSSLLFTLLDSSKPHLRKLFKWLFNLSPSLSSWNGRAWMLALCVFIMTMRTRRKPRQSGSPKASYSNMTGSDVTWLLYLELRCQRECCIQVPVGRDRACCNDQMPRLSSSLPTPATPPPTNKPTRNTKSKDSGSDDPPSAPTTWIVIPIVIMSVFLFSAVLVFVCHCYNPQKRRVLASPILYTSGNRGRRRNRLHPQQERREIHGESTPCPPYIESTLQMGPIDTTVTFSTATHLVDMAGLSETCTSGHTDFLPDYNMYMSKTDLEYQSRVFNEFR